MVIKNLHINFEFAVTAYGKILILDLYLGCVVILSTEVSEVTVM